MSHQWSDTDPEEVKKEQEHVARWQKIKKELKDTSLSKLTVGDMPLILKFFGPNCGSDRCTKEIFQLMEKRLAEIKRKCPTF